MVPKTQVREHARLIRARTEVAVRDARGERIVRRCRELLDWASYARVHVFLPIQVSGEIGTWELVEWIWNTQRHIQLYVPRLADGEMEHVEVTSSTRFQTNVFGIPEPVEGKTARPGAHFDLVLTPLLAFDNQGNRVGYGRGYYDRFLATQQSAYAVGLAHEAWRVTDSIAVEQHDVRVSAVVTEERLYNFE
jgi:5-formyltetrahydrofolate cyclo-ligase